MMRSPHNALEDITKRSDKSIDELVDWICQLTCRAQIGNGSDAAIEFRVQCRLIWVIPDTDTELCKQLLKVSHDKKVLHLLEICRTYYTVESEWLQCVQVMQYMLPHATPARHMSQSHRCHMHHAPTAPINTLPVDTTALPKTQHVKVVGKKVTSKQNATALAPLSLQVSCHQLWSKSHGKERETQAAKAKTEKRPPHKDLFIAAMDCRTVGDMHPRR